MKAPEKNHTLIAFIGLILLLLAGWVYVEVAFSQEQPVSTPEMQAIQEKWTRVQDELNHLNAIVALHQGRIKVLNSELKGFQDRFDVLFRQQQMEKKRAEMEMERMRAEEAKKRAEAEKVKAPEKK